MSKIGETFIANSSNDSGFDNFTALITDGVDMNTYFTHTPIYHLDSHESCVFHSDCSGSSGVDFRGYVIDQVTYQVKGWYHDSPGRNPNGDGFWTDTYFGYRMTIEGHPIPEPSTLILLTIGAVGVLVFARRRRHQP